jgi:hypothetical protein
MGLELPILWLSLLMFGGLAVLLMLGLPMAFCTGSLGCCSCGCSAIPRC